MSKAFNEYQAAVQLFSQTVREISQEINQNRNDHAAAVKQLEDHLVMNQPVGDLEKKLLELDSQLRILSYKSDALNRSKERGSNSFVKDAALKVLSANKASLEALRKTWAEEVAKLKAIMRNYFDVVIGMRAIHAEGKQLEEEVALAGKDAGQQVYYEPPGANLNVQRQQGDIFPSLKEIAEVWRSGIILAESDFISRIDPPEAEEDIELNRTISSSAESNSWQSNPVFPRRKHAPCSRQRQGTD